MMTPTAIQIDIVLGEVEHLEPLAELMDQYRVFYGQESNLPAARHFLFERIINHDSVIYLAQDAATGEAVGFTQLYPSFSSVTLEPLWILNDLYVKPAFRKQGAARSLIRKAIELVEAREDKGLILETAHDNLPMQRLSESMGFARDTHFRHYAYTR